MQGKDIILVVDYHAENIEFRWFNEATGEERTGRYATTRDGILRQVDQARREVAPGGQVVWIMESTTGWARVKDLIGARARFVLANVLQMPQDLVDLFGDPVYDYFGIQPNGTNNLRGHIQRR